jgi:hypothetical protein
MGSEGFYNVNGNNEKLLSEEKKELDHCLSKRTINSDEVDVECDGMRDEFSRDNYGFGENQPPIDVFEAFDMGFAPTGQEFGNNFRRTSKPKSVVNLGNKDFGKKDFYETKFDEFTVGDAAGVMRSVKKKRPDNNPYGKGFG